MSARTLRSLQLGLAVAGGILFAVLVRAIGVAAITTALERLGAGFLVVVLFELVTDGCNTRGWQCTLAPGTPIGFWRLYWIRQAGTAINLLTPTASLGGEVVKGMLLRGTAGAADVVASLVVSKLSLVIAQATVVLLGIGLAVRRLHDAPQLALAIVAGFAVLVAALAAVVVVQRRGWVGGIGAAFARVAPRARLALALRDRGAALDHRLEHLWRERPGALVASVAWHTVGQLIGLVQLWFILGALGVGASFATCLAIEAASLVIDSAMFVVPGRVGVQEGGRVLIFSAFGLGAATGLAVAIVVRLNQLAVSATGLAAFAYFSWSSTPLADSISGS
jgi:uncharacterized protein (TIRG00374 family)